jgi:hypothetical protein
MRRGWVCIAVCTVVLCLILVACGGGNSKPAALPAKGAEVCDEVKGAERFRYTFTQIIESPQQANPPEDSAGGDYATKPSQPDFRFELKHSGSAVRPDRLDFVISTTPDQPTVRTIRIGQNQWYFLGDAWQVAPNPENFPYTPPNICDVIVSPLDLEGETADLETVGDVKARHVRIDGAPLTAGSQLFGPTSDFGRLLTSFDVDLWLSEKKNRVVKVEAVSKGTYPYGRELTVTIILEIGSYNDGDIDIQPPL